MGCAHPKPAPAPPRLAAVQKPLPPPTPTPPKVRLVVLPLEKFALPGTADKLNEKLSLLKLDDCLPPVLATLSMESAQLQSDCAQPSNECFVKIAHKVESDRILWVDVEKVAKKKKKGPVKIKLSLFDAVKGTMLSQVEETYPAAISDEALDALIGKLTGTPTSAPISTVPPPAAAEPPPPSVPPPPRPAMAAPGPVAKPTTAPAALPPASPARAK